MFKAKEEGMASEGQALALAILELLTEDELDAYLSSKGLVWIPENTG